MSRRSRSSGTRRRDGPGQGRGRAGYHGRPDKADNILDPVEDQVSWLRGIGFEQADVYFKWPELAVFGGQKPLGT